MYSDVLRSIVKKAVGTRMEPSSWTGALYVFLAVLAIALAALPAILARRKAAKLAHKVDLLEEERKQEAFSRNDAQSENELAMIDKKVEELDDEIVKIEDELDGLDEKRRSLSAELDELTDWEDLNMGEEEDAS